VAIFRQGSCDVTFTHCYHETVLTVNGISLHSCCCCCRKDRDVLLEDPPGGTGDRMAFYGRRQTPNYHSTMVQHSSSRSCYYCNKNPMLAVFPVKLFDLLYEALARELSRIFREQKSSLPDYSEFVDLGTATTLLFINSISLAVTLVIIP
jgi:hypothetical protein